MLAEIIGGILLGFLSIVCWMEGGHFGIAGGLLFGFTSIVLLDMALEDLSSD